jgi:hypothetical protein
MAQLFGVIGGSLKLERCFCLFKKVITRLFIVRKDEILSYKQENIFFRAEASSKKNVDFSLLLKN